MLVDIAGDDTQKATKLSLMIGAGTWLLIQSVSFIVFMIHSGVGDSDELFVYYASGVLSLLSAAVVLLYILVLLAVNKHYQVRKNR